MARQEPMCWRCRAAWNADPATPTALPPAAVSSLRARTGHVLDARARRRAESARHDRRATTRRAVS